MAEPLLDLLLLVQAGVAASLLGLAFYCNRFPQPPARAMARLVFVAGIWGFLAVMIHLSPDLSTKIFLNRIKMATICWIPLLSLSTYIAIQIQQPIPRLAWIGLCLPCIFTSVLCLSPWHELLITGYHLFPFQHLDLLGFSNGNWFGSYITYTRLIMFGAFIPIFWPQEKTHRHHRMVRWLLALSLLIPTIGDLIAVHFFPTMRFLQTTTFVFLIPAIILVYAVFRYRIHEVVPFGRNEVLENSDDLIVITNPEGNLLDFNQRAAEVLQLSNKNILKPFSPPESMASSQLFPSGQTTYSLYFRKLEKSGMHLGSLWHFKDVSLQLRTIEELAAVNQIKTLLLGVLGHDLQSHLAALALESEDLSRYAETYSVEAVQSSAESIFLGTRDCISFVEQAVAWSKTQLGTHLPSMQKVELRPTIQRVVSSLSTSLTAKDLEVDIHLEDPALNVWADPFLLSTIIRNLLANAIQASPPKERIVIAIETRESKTYVKVQDRGPGLCREHIDDILERGRPSTSQGLGLLICKDFSKAMNATLEVENRGGSETQMGAAFQLVFTSP